MVLLNSASTSPGVYLQWYVWTKLQFILEYYEMVSFQNYKGSASSQQTWRELECLMNLKMVIMFLLNIIFTALVLKCMADTPIWWVNHLSWALGLMLLNVRWEIRTSFEQLFTLKLFFHSVSYSTGSSEEGRNTTLSSCVVTVSKDSRDFHGDCVLSYWKRRKDTFYFDIFL